MTFFQWRRFNFFDSQREVDGGALDATLQKSGSNLTEVVSGRGYIICGDDQGNLHILNRQFTVQSFKIFDGPILTLTQIRLTGLLACLGKDDEYLLKIYDLDKPDKNESPTLVRTSRLSIKGLGQSVPTTIAVSESLNLLSIGFNNGAILLMRGDITKDRGTKMKLIIEPDQVATITGLSFKLVSRHSWLYVATVTKIFLIDVSAKDKESKSELDSLGAKDGLSIGVDGVRDAHFVVARNDAIYFYSTDGRGQCYAIEGEKTAIHSFRNYLVIVSNDNAQNNRMARPNDVINEKSRSILSVFDLQNKFIAYTAPVRTIKAVFSEWGSLFTISMDLKMSQLTEKDIQSKLELLFKKNFYDVAIKIAKSQHYDEEGLIDIFRQYGDHLYSKGDLSGAIDNYIKTIGHLEPSYVIRRFLDAFRIHNLTAYLQALHKEGLANNDHTILLLNCYTKLKDHQKLDEFIFKDRDSVDFDLEVAIKVCRQAGYHDHASSLAETHRMHSVYLEIQLEDRKNYSGALEYMEKIDFQSAQENMEKYGAILMKHLPQKTTTFLKKLCTEYRSPNEALVDEKGDSIPSRSARPEHFLHLFVKNSECAVDFLEYMIKMRPRDMTDTLYNALLEHLFHLYQFYGDKKSGSGDKEQLENKILMIMRDSKVSFDPDHALILSQMHGFSRGCLFLYEKKELHDQILKHHIDMGQVTEALNTCRRFGSQNPNLWVQALQWISDQSDNVSPSDVSEILEMIERHHLMSPLLVVRTLAGSKNSTLGLVRDFLLNVLKTENSKLAEDEEIIEQYKIETKKVQEKIAELKSSAVTFQVSQCAACHHLLEVPTVHFLCQHSYHQHCFESCSESDYECPTCAPENKKIMAIVTSQQNNRDQHDSFHGQLEKADDGFSVVADYFGRGLFRPQIDLKTLRVVDDQESSRPQTPTISTSVLGQDDGSRKLNASIPRPFGEEKSSSKVGTPTFSSSLSSTSRPQAKPSSAVGGLGAYQSHQGRSQSPFSGNAPKATNPVQLRTKVKDSSSDEKNKQHSTLNPFGDFEEPASNPFGDPDEDYDDNLNPFS